MSSLLSSNLFIGYFYLLPMNQKIEVNPVVWPLLPPAVKVYSVQNKLYHQLVKQALNVINLKIHRSNFMRKIY